MTRKTLLIATIAITASSLGSWGNSASAASKTKNFRMTVSSAAAGCLPNAEGRVTVKSVGPSEKLRVRVSGLKPNTNYDLFVIQVPDAPFGLSWYQGDIETNSDGIGVGNFVGRFNSETFIVAPGPAIVPEPVHPADAAAASLNPAIAAPIHTYHLGLWFNSPDDAVSWGCSDKVTPFNGEHTAGIQVLNTGSFADDNGPLRTFNP